MYDAQTAAKEMRTKLEHEINDTGLQVEDINRKIEETEITIHNIGKKEAKMEHEFQEIKLVKKHYCTNKLLQQTG